MKKVIKNNYKFILGIIVGLIISVTSVYAIDAYIESNKVTYTNHNKTNVQDAIDELYERSGIHKEKWIDPILNGADPVLKDPLIPVEIKPNGDVYYANLNSEWYNYSEKRWANAVILTDTAGNYSTGAKIDDKNIKGYFVWIPRYQYKVWDLGKYEKTLLVNDLDDDANDPTKDTTLWKLTGVNARIVDIKFGSVEKLPKMNESEAAIDKYYTHPAFTLGDKNLNGIWVGKFETGGSASNVVVRPKEITWRISNLREFFDAGKSFASNLDSHMMKNTEWGAAAYLSHSQYGIGKEVNINNVSEYKTGYSADPSTNQNISPGKSGLSSNEEITKTWNSTVGYLASTTGNISGIYDMSGGSWERMAACMPDIPSESGFTSEEILEQMNLGYIDKYSSESTGTSYKNRILGDATGELGPFYRYVVSDGTSYTHNSWYSDWANFIDKSLPCFIRGGWYKDGSLGGQFNFSRDQITGSSSVTFRIALAPTK